MPSIRFFATLLITAPLTVGCAAARSDAPKPLYRSTAVEVDQVIRETATNTPELRDRILQLARQNLRQPYDIYLLGEAPFETIDDQPIYCLDRSDCVVFTEHTIAMALSDDFPSFLRMLQRIRYKDGEIGVLTRNHYTEADWNVNNRWLATDITTDLVGEKAGKYKSTINRKSFFKKRYKLDTDIPSQTIEETYVPYAIIPEVKGQLRTGDIVEFVKGTSDNSAWVHHMGLVAVLPDGQVNLIHSTWPRVREEPIEAFIKRNTRNNERNDRKKVARHRGFKFLRLADDPIANLRAIDGDNTPNVVLPADGTLTWDAFVERAMKQPLAKPVAWRREE